MKNQVMAGRTNHLVISDVPPGFLRKRIIRNHFGKFGAIERITIFNGLCIITFENQEQAEKAKVHGALWKELPLKIEFTDRNDLFDTEGIDLNEELNWHVEDESDEKKRKSSKTKTNLRGTDAPPKKSIRMEEDGDDPFSIEESKSVSTNKEIPFQSSAAKTLKEKLEILEERDRYLRVKLEKIGKVDASSVIKGICPDMCPEKERLMRDVNCIVAPYESFSNGRMDHAKAVKEYTRSSADQDEPLPHELRPEPVLTMTMSYIINYIMSRIDEENDENYANWYDFCWGRLRAIRKDMIQQQLCDINVVTILEQCARFHITCYDRLWGTSKSHFDDKINTETLVNCLQSLIHMYEDLHREGVVCPNEPEFNAYMILLKLNSGLLMSEYRRYSSTVKRSHEVKEAVKIHLAYNNNMFSTYFKLVKQTSYLNACLMQRFFHYVRIKALHTIVKSHSVPNKVSKISVDFIMNMLKIDSVNECISFCDSLGLTLGEDEKYFRISRNEFIIPENIFAVKTPSSLVVNKRIPVAQAVVGVDKPLPIYIKHSVHSSFNEEGLLKPDAVDASDQEEKMLFDIVARNMEQTKLKGVSSFSQNIVPLDIENNELALNSSTPQKETVQISGDGKDRNVMIDVYEDVSDAPTKNEKPVEGEAINISVDDESSNESVVSLNSNSSSISTKSSNKTPDLKLPSPSISPSKSFFKFTPYTAKTSAPLLFGPSSNQTVTCSKTLVNSSISTFNSFNQSFSFSKGNLNLNSKLEKEAKNVLSDEESSMSKLRKKLSENLKRISAKKYLKLWQKKVARIKAMKAAEALVICNVSAESHLKIWGYPYEKHFITTSDRLNERKKAGLMVKLILNTNIVDKLDKNVSNISKKLVDILGEVSLDYANNSGNNPQPVFSKLVFALPPPLQEGSTFPMKFKIWCKEAFSNRDSTNEITNVAITLASNGVTVFSNVIIIEGLENLEETMNLTSLILITACGWEKPEELEKRMFEILRFKNHPIPVGILNLGDDINKIISPNYDQITYFEQILWKNADSMTQILSDLAHNIYICNLKVIPFCSLVEIYVSKLFDMLRQDRFFHSELDVALLSPNTVILYYNQLVNFIEMEIKYCFQHNLYGTALEFKYLIKELQNYFCIWPDGYCDHNFLHHFSLRITKCMLNPFVFQNVSAPKDLLSFFRLYCDNLGCPEVVSTVMRLIKPPEEDSKIQLSAHLDTVDWIRIVELLSSKVLSSRFLTFKVVFREERLNNFINSHFWLESDYVKHLKNR